MIEKSEVANILRDQELNNWRLYDMRGNMIADYILQGETEPAIEKLNEYLDMVEQYGRVKVYAGQDKHTNNNFAHAKRLTVRVGETDGNSSSHGAVMNNAATLGLQKQVYDRDLELYKSQLDNKYKLKELEAKISDEKDRFVPAKYDKYIDMAICKHFNIPFKDLYYMNMMNADMTNPETAKLFSQYTSEQTPTNLAGKKLGLNEDRPGSGTDAVPTAQNDAVIEDLNNNLEALRLAVGNEKLNELAKKLKDNPQMADTALNFLK